MERNGLVVTVTLDRPESRNALDRELMVELTQMFGALSGDGTRVIVLTGSGSAFCAGADIEWMRESRTLTDEDNIADAATARAMERSVLPLFTMGAIKVAVAETYPLSEAPTAYEHFQRGGKLGKIVLTTD